MATIKFKRGITGPTGLTLGEPAWNYVDNKLYVGVTASAIWVGAEIDTSTSLGTSNIKLPTQAAVKTYVDSTVTGSVSGVSSYNGRTGAVQGVSAAVAGSGISVSGATGTVTITNTGVLTVNGQTGNVTVTGGGSSGVLTYNGRTGAVEGVSAAAAGLGISVSGATGSVTITNTGVLSFNGSTGAVTGVASINGSTGAITNVARLNEGNTFSVRQIMNAGISAANLQVNSGVTFNNIDLRSTTSTIQGYNTGGYLKMQSVGTIMVVPGNPSIVLQDADTDSGGIPNITINPSPAIAGTNTLTLGNSTTATTISGTATITGTSTLTGRSTHTGGITSANLYVTSGATFNSTTSHTGLATFTGGITANTLYVTGGSTFIGNISAPNMVNSNVAGTGISVSGATGNVTITNTGVQSFNGSTGAITGVSSINGFTGAVSITYAAATTITSSNTSATTYPVFALGAGNTGLFIDNVTTPLSYVPSTGTLTGKSYVAQGTGTSITTNGSSITITLTDGTNVAALNNTSLGHNGDSNFVVSSNVGVEVDAIFTVADPLGSWSYTFPQSNGSNGQVLTTDGLGNLSWAEKTNSTTQTIDFSSSINNIAFTLTGLTSSNQVYAFDRLSGYTAYLQNASGSINIVGTIDSSESYTSGGTFINNRSADLVMKPPFTQGITSYTAESLLGLTLVYFGSNSVFTRLLGSSIEGDGATAGITFAFGITFAASGLTLQHKESTYTTSTITGQSWVTADKYITCKCLGLTTADHDAEDAILEGVRFEINNIVAGTGFDIIGHAPEGTYGKYKIKCLGQ
jgi:hypothetical protein